MFSKSRPTDPVPQPAAPQPELLRTSPESMASPQKPKPAASVMSSDITITGNVHSSGDIQIEGTVEGDIRAQTLIVGETATIKGEVMAEEVVVHGRVIGRLRGLKVRLSSTARVEGDIIHKTIAIEAGAHFEGSVHRQEDPLAQAGQPARLSAPVEPRPSPPVSQAAE